jgi:tryptophan synthase alpha chain
VNALPVTSTIDQTFARTRAAGQMAFMPFITAGDPDMATTVELIELLAGCGVDLIEIGFPYSDPIADGPVIQSSYTRALAKRLHVSDIFAGIAELTGRNRSLPPLVAMVSYAIIFRIGSTEFVRQAKAAGFSGVIVPDLPADEAEDMSRQCQAAALNLVELIAPTTTKARTAKILETSKGFLYCISVAGVTGARTDLPAELQEQLAWLKSQTALPLAVGFGVSRPEQVAGLKGLADGVIVGSAIVRHVGRISEENCPKTEAFGAIRDLATAMVQATRAS